MKHFFPAVLLLLGYICPILAQEKSPLTISGYAEAYYMQDFNRPLNNTRPGFIYSHNRVSEVNLNLAFLKANYTTEKIRGNLTIATGTYMHANYAAEPGVLQNIYEANIGVSISEKRNLWIDVGIMPSHIGFESAIGRDNWTLTRSVLADNSPYYEAGAKIGYSSPSGKWYMAGLYLNGWQRIQRVEGNTTPAFGHQLTFRPNDRITLNSSSFVGNDKADSVKQMRYFHNFYMQFQFSRQFGLIADFDIGWEQRNKGSNRYNNWYTTALILRYGLNDQVNLSVRGEYYRDKNRVIISNDIPSGFQSWGYSLGLDYAILPNLLWRAEFRNLSSKSDIFTKRNGAPTGVSPFTATALAISF